MEIRGLRTGGKGRNPLSVTDPRTPIVDNLISMLPSGHDKALKYAFYNVLALILAGVCILGLWAVHCVLEPFIKSLLWALLCGSVLYPFKRKLVTAAQGWLRRVVESPAPFTLHVLSSPVLVTDAISVKIGDYAWNYWKPIGGGLGTFFVTYVLYYNPPVTLGLVMKWILTTAFDLSIKVLAWVSFKVVLAFHVVYGSVIFNTMMASTAATLESRGEVKEDTEILQESSSLKESSVDGSSISTKTVERANYNSEASRGNIIKVLSILTWSFTMIYIGQLLPYTVLIPVVVSMIAGAVTYFRSGQKDDSQYTIPKMSLFAAQLVLKNIASSTRINSRRSIDEGKNSQATPVSLKSRNSIGTPMDEIVRQLSKEGERDKAGKPEVDINYVPTPGKTLESPVFTEDSEDEVDGGLLDSNKFLYGVFIACIIVQVWQHLWLVHLLPIPVLYYGLKRLALKFGLVEYLKASVTKPITNFYSKDTGLSREMFPGPVRALFQILSIADRKVGEFCEAYLDPVASSLVLVVVIMFTTILLIFAATQVYMEGDHLVRVCIDIVNSTVSQHPEINRMLPENWESIMSDMIGNAHVYGKEYITNTIRDSIEEKDPEKAHEIEKQLIELWDKIYLSWNKTWEPSKELNEAEGSGIEWNELLESGKNVPLEFSVLANYAKANLGTLRTVMESLWSILIGNVSIAISAITAVLSVVLGGGTAIVNLMINFVVFFTALFYLLSSSTSVYKPIELFNTWIPGNGKHSNRFLNAVEEAVNGVFTASFKMAAFYGMWTWLVHSLFQINIVFVPSFLAALFGAVPLLMPYWAALPAVLELSFIQGNWTRAIFMMLAQMAPMSMVDTQIYSEIKGGGHPYLTGLAVAGGIFYFGMQGAIMGPVILGCVFVAVKMGSSFLREEPEDTIVHHPPRSLIAQRSESQDDSISYPSGNLA